MKIPLRSIASVVLCFPLFLPAQEPVQPAAGSKAMLFSFAGLSNLNLNEFEGGIGGKYIVSNNISVRGGVVFAIAGASIPSNPPPGQTGTDGSVSATQFGVTAGMEYFLARGRVSPYLGAGAGIRLTSTESKNAVVGTAAQTTVKNNRNGEVINGMTFAGGTTMSIFGMAGLEYFIMTGLSLSAEYRLGYGFTSRSDEEQTSGNTTVTTKLGTSDQLGISTGGVLTLAVYF